MSERSPAPGASRTSSELSDRHAHDSSREPSSVSLYGKAQPDLVIGLRDSLRGMTDAEAAVVVMAAAAQNSRAVAVANLSADFSAAGQEELGVRRPGDAPRTGRSQALSIEDEELLEEIEERWAHSSRHRFVVKVSFAALVLAWAGMAVVIGLLGYELATRIEDPNLYITCLGAIFVGVAIPLTL